MRVHSCVVSDGGNDVIQLFDAGGCTVDRYALQDLEFESLNSLTYTSNPDIQLT
jgi:hypothetical protein